jgi:hypothetical protein
MRTLLGLFVTGAIRRPRSGSGDSSSRQRASSESPTALAFHKLRSANPKSEFRADRAHFPPSQGTTRAMNRIAV